VTNLKSCSSVYCWGHNLTRLFERLFLCLLSADQGTEPQLICLKSCSLYCWGHIVTRVSESPFLCVLSANQGIEPQMICLKGCSSVYYWGHGLNGVIHHHLSHIHCSCTDSLCRVCEAKRAVHAEWVRSNHVFCCFLLLLLLLCFYSIQRKTWVPHMNKKKRNKIYVYIRFTV